MNTPQENQRTAFTLDEIHQLRAEKLAEIRTSKQRIANHARELFHPSGTTNGANSLMNNFHSGIAILNGIMTGFKIIKRIRDLFRRK